jgi:DNA sulfur modification protein DndB
MKKSLNETGAEGRVLPVTFAGLNLSNPADEWVLPAIRGVQARREYYVVLVKLREVPRLFAPVDAKTAPEFRAQRTLNKGRVPKIASYILGNPEDYTFSSLVGAIDGLPRFEPAGEKSRLGTLYIPRSMPVALLDGQHRRAAIEHAVREDNAKKKGSTGVGDETISVVLFIDNGLEKAQQKFADLNRFGVSPNGSLSLLYDHRDELANLAKAVVREVPLFAKLTDGEKTSIAGGSGKLFALRAVHEATRALLRGSNDNREESRKLAVAFWSETAGALPDWQAVAEREIKASELRAKYIHAHAAALEAIGRTGNALLRGRPEMWTKDLAGLATLDWSRSSSVWAGRAVINGRVSKTPSSEVLTADALKNHLGPEIWVEGRRVEGLHEARMWGGLGAVEAREGRTAAFLFALAPIPVARPLELPGTLPGGRAPIQDVSRAD